MGIQVNWQNHPMPGNKILGGRLECFSCGTPCEFSYGRGVKVFLNQECADEVKRKKREEEVEKDPVSHN